MIPSLLAAALLQATYLSNSGSGILLKSPNGLQGSLVTIDNTGAR